MTTAFDKLKEDSDSKIITYSEFMILYNEVQSTCIEKRLLQAHDDYIKNITKINTNITCAEDVISTFDDIVRIQSLYRSTVRSFEEEYKKIKHGKKFIQLHGTNTILSFQDGIVVFLSTMIDYKNYDYTINTTRVFLTEQEYCKIKLLTRDIE